jgi:very-short-patch-repair endonuclease
MGEKVDHICERCGKTFRGALNRKYCSELCRRPPLVLTCETCGKPFRVVPSMSYQKFCSPSCYRKHTGETTPEANARRCLTLMNERFIQEAAIDRYPVDFYLPDRNVVLEIDGVYWHKRPDADRRKTLRLQSKGYIVIRLPDTPFYGEVGQDMLGVLHSAIAAAINSITGDDLPRSYPLQLSLPID